MFKPIRHHIYTSNRETTTEFFSTFFAKPVYATDIKALVF